jgi:PAS domain S-box-containing protein
MTTGWELLRDVSTMERSQKRRTDDAGIDDLQGRSLGLAVLVALGIGFVAVGLYQLRAVPVNGPSSQLSVLGYAVYGLSLLGTSGWLARRQYATSHVWRVVGWCLLGTITVVALAVVAIASQQTLGVDLVHPGLVVAQLAGTGALGGVLTGVYDSHRAMARRKRRAVAERMDALVSASPVALVSLTPDGTVEGWNRAATETFGYTNHEAVGDEYPLLDEDASLTIDDIVGADSLDGVETTHVRRDDRVIDVRIWTAPIREAGGERTGTVVALVDTTERKQRRRQLELFQQAVEQATNSICITDVDGTIEYVNPAFERATGYDAAEAIGETPAIVKSGKQSDAFYRELWETILDGREWHANIVNRRKSGELYEVSQTITPITDESGDIARFVAIEDDVSVQVRRRQQLQVLQRVLRHNLGNDTTVLLGHAEELLDRDPIASDPDLRESVERMRETAEGLLDLSETVRLTRQALPDERTVHDPIDAGTLAEDLAADLRERFPAATVTVTVPETTYYVSTVVEPAIEELLDNAVKHADSANPRVDVTVATCEDDEWVEIAVADDGPGIPEEEREVLRRGEETPLMHGSGLGLWLVNWIASTVGGEVTIDDNDPRGSVVTLRALARDSPAAERTGGPTPEARAARPHLGGRASRPRASGRTVEPQAED